jgi:hypothetical protein
MKIKINPPLNFSLSFFLQKKLQHTFAYSKLNSHKIFLQFHDIKKIQNVPYWPNHSIPFYPIVTPY